MGKSRASIYLIKLYCCCLEILLLLLLLLVFFLINSYIITIVLTNCKLPRHSEVYDCM